jgi:CheY-like chemotaxis protein
MGDPVRLQQILVNLASNAIKFTSAGSITCRIEVEAKSEELLTDRTVTLLFSITDTGLGIPADRQQAIFEAFTQADGSITRKFGGTGLGLAITSNLIELFGGKISVVSAEDQGSSFRFAITFAIAEAAIAVEHSADLTLPSLAILLAEDNPVNQRLMSTLLNRLNHSVTLACDGVEAVRLFREGSFDVILMDMQMPNMDGLQATRQIRDLESSGAHGAGRRTPIVALTANALESNREESFRAGVDGYATKPIRINDLIEEIGRCLRAVDRVPVA